jgi:hypothetical protein
MQINSPDSVPFFGYGRDVKRINPYDFDAILTTVLSAKNKRNNVLNPDIYIFGIIMLILIHLFRKLLNKKACSCLPQGAHPLPTSSTCSKGR